MPNVKPAIHFFSAKDEFNFISDTIIDKNSETDDTLVLQETAKDTTKQKDTISNQKIEFNQQQIDSILRVSEARIQQIEQQQQAIESKQKKIYNRKQIRPRFFFANLE